MITDHPANELIRAYRLGNLKAGSAESIRTHLRECPQCRRKVEGMTQVEGTAEDGPLAEASVNRPSARPSGSTLVEAESPSAATASEVPELQDYKVIRQLGSGGITNSDRADYQPATLRLWGELV